jgi:prophage tail gpP-like protein
VYKPAARAHDKGKSPMAGLDQELWIKSCTFTQDNQSGTQTHLELLNKPQGVIPLVGGDGSRDFGSGSQSAAQGATIEAKAPLPGCRQCA